MQSVFEGRVRRGLAAVWIALAGTGGALAQGPVRGADASGAPEAESMTDDRAGHERMVALLREVYGRAGEDDPYLGDGRYRAERAALEAMGPSVPAAERAHQALQAGSWALRAGLFDEAVEVLEEGERLLAGTPVALRPDFEVELLYVLGVTHLRRGETQNCVARHTSRSCILPITGDAVHVDQTGSRRAMEYFGKVLRRRGAPEALRVASRWLLNVAAMTVGEHPGGLPEELVVPLEALASEVDFPRFVDVAPELGLNTFDLAGGALAGDLDGDGALDLVHSSWDPGEPVRLHTRDAEGRFVARPLDGRGELTGGLNLVPADYDGDGDLDVLVLRGAWRTGRAGRIPNSLLRNDGTGVFTDVTFAAGLGEEHHPTQTAAWADYDNDGDLDLYVGNECGREDSIPSQLFRNEGDGTFEEVGRAAGVANWRFAKAVVWGDYDGDRWPDLFVSNLGGHNRLYHNRGDGTFEDVAEEAGVRAPRDSFPAWFWDYDNDGALDLYVSCYFDAGGLGRLAPSVAGYLGEDLGAETPRLYRGDGRGGFADVTAAAGVDRVSMPMGANFGDLDDDGRLDFYLGTGYPFFDGLMPNLMYWNRGERFADVTEAGGFGHLQKGHGVVFVDLDGDGDQDVFEQMGGAFRGDGFGNVLYENPGFGNHWLEVELVGVRSNRSAIGARLRLDFDDGGEPRSVFRHVSTGGSFGANPLLQHVGIGGAERVRRLEVYWPTSDTTQVFEDLEADRRLRVVEGAEAPEVVARGERPFPD